MVRGCHIPVRVVWGNKAMTKFKGLAEINKEFIKFASFAPFLGSPSNEMREFDRGRGGSPKFLLALGLYLFGVAVSAEFHSKHQSVKFLIVMVQ